MRDIYAASTQSTHKYMTLYKHVVSKQVNWQDDTGLPKNKLIQENFNFWHMT